VSDGGTWYRHDSSSNRKLVRGSKFPRAFSAPPSRFCDPRPSSLLSLATYATHPMVDERRNEFPSSDKRALALGIDKKRRVIERHCHITTAPSQLFFSISCESWLHYIHDFLLTNCIIGQTKKIPAIDSEQKGRGKMHHCLQFLPKNPFLTAFVFFAGDSKRGKRYSTVEVSRVAPILPQSTTIRRHSTNAGVPRQHRRPLTRNAAALAFRFGDRGGNARRTRGGGTTPGSG
jgi:hypothetical protein